MNQLASNLNGGPVYLDDILISGKNTQEHLQNLNPFLQHLDDKGLRCHLEKWAFAQPVVEYLGHKLSHEQNSLWLLYIPKAFVVISTLIIPDCWLSGGYLASDQQLASCICC